MYCSYNCRYQQNLIASLEDLKLTKDHHVEIDDPDDYEYSTERNGKHYVTLSEWYSHYLNDEPLFDDEATRDICLNGEELAFYIESEPYIHCLTCQAGTSCTIVRFKGQQATTQCINCGNGHIDMPQGDLSWRIYVIIAIERSRECHTKITESIYFATKRMPGSARKSPRNLACRPTPVYIAERDTDTTRPTDMSHFVTSNVTRRANDFSNLFFF